MPILINEGDNQVLTPQIFIQSLGNQSLSNVRNGISLSTYTFGIKSFENVFGQKNGVLHPRVSKVSFEDLNALILASTIQESKIFIAIYHGLDKHGNIEHGIRLLEGQWNGDEAELQNDLSEEAWSLPSHCFKNNRIQIANQNDWKILQSRYYQEVTVKRDGYSSPEDINISSDPKAVLFPWEREIKKLFIDNQIESQVPSKELRYVISDFSDHLNEYSVISFQGIDGFRHSKVLHIERFDQTRSIPLLGNGFSISSLHFRGIEYGNLCPPRCKFLKF